MRNKRSLCLALLAQLRSYRSMPTEKQLLEQAKQLQGQTSATDEAPVTIFAALLLADTIRAAGSGISVKTIVVLRTLLRHLQFYQNRCLQWRFVGEERL